jgi:restriction system protein
MQDGTISTIALLNVAIVLFILIAPLVAGFWLWLRVRRRRLEKDAADRQHQISWKEFGHNLKSYQQFLSRNSIDREALQEYLLSRGAPADGISIYQVQSLLSAAAIGPPHGLDLLQPISIPDFPKCPRPPLGTPPLYAEREVEKAKTLERQAQAIRRQYEREAAELENIRIGCVANQTEAICALMLISHQRHFLPKPLRSKLTVEIDRAARVVLCVVEIPGFDKLPIVRMRGRSWSPASATERKRANETILHSLCLRAASLIAKCDVGDWFDTVAINAEQSWVDAATGVARHGVIASLQVSKEQIIGLKLELVEPKSCFNHLKGITTPSIDEVSPIRPIFVLNTDDSRIIKNRDIDATLQREANLAAMPWEDFEQLVRQLFEWEFGKAGVEVKVTRASRDRGVDAIMFDPDPLRGGKYVLQAKRYTRPVDVAAVRDLYGTVVNEGANRGILVSTSSYGPDAYDFAKDKPISLVDGPNLIAMLRRHGRMFRIDLAEARRMESGVDAATSTSRNPMD